MAAEARCTANDPDSFAALLSVENVASTLGDREIHCEIPAFCQAQRGQPGTENDIPGILGGRGFCAM